jgi:ribosomal protein S18 acetylase RimI-like enzyme
MIRPTVPADTPTLLAITAGTGLFTPPEVGTLDEVLKEYHAEHAALDHHCATYEQDGTIVGFTYFAPAPMTDRTWELWWIVVSKQIQARGIGGELLRYAEEGARAEKGRLMMVPTSSLPSYELTRRFYAKHGYEVAGILKDYYADGHDMYLFRKRL